MKTIFINLLFLFSFASTHDVQIATFTIYQESNQLQFRVEIEKKDILKTFEERQLALNKNTIGQYLKEHFIISVNDKKTNLQITSFNDKAKHIYISGKVTSLNKKIRKIKIRNTCLLNIEGHSNIIALRINNSERDFLINANRKEIKAKF